jgi:hypothetical protein
VFIVLLHFVVLSGHFHRAQVRGAFAGPIHDLAHVRAVLSRLGGLLARWRVVLAFLFLLEVAVRLPKVVMYS